MEAYGEFSLEACVELAWMCGLVRYDAKANAWLDAETGKPVADRDVKKKYEARLLAHCGIRLVEPAINHGYDPHAKRMMQSIAVDFDLRPVEIAGGEEEARQYKAELGDKVDVWAAGDGRWFMKVLRGAEARFTTRRTL